MKPLLLFMLLPVFSYSQKIKVSEIDRFTKQKRVETSTIYVRQGLVCGLGFYYRSVDTTYFIDVTGFKCAVGVIGSNDSFLFLLEDNSTVEVHSSGIQDYEISSSQFGISKSYTHEYYITLEGIKKLSKSKLLSVRAYLSDGYADVDVKDKRQDDLIKLSQIFLKEINK